MTSMILKVKYLTFKNLAGMAKEQGDLSAAIDAYIQVCPMFVYSTIVCVTVLCVW